mgnify:FL=1
MKRRMLQQICALALTGTMLLGLTACGSSSPDTPAQTPDNSAEENSSSAEETKDTGAESAASSGSGDVSELYWFSDVSGWGPATAN